MYKHQKSKKLALNLQLQTYQILTNDDQMLILCLSYFIATVQDLFWGEISAFSSVIIFAVSPSIDKGQAGSKTVRTNRTAIWQIKCKGGKRRNTLLMIHLENKGSEFQTFSQNSLMNVCLYAIFCHFQLKFDDLVK